MLSAPQGVRLLHQRMELHHSHDRQNAADDHAQVSQKRAFSTKPLQYRTLSLERRSVLGTPNLRDGHGLRLSTLEFPPATGGRRSTERFASFQGNEPSVLRGRSFILGQGRDHLSLSSHAAPSSRQWGLQDPKRASLFSTFEAHRGETSGKTRSVPCGRKLPSVIAVTQSRHTPRASSFFLSTRNILRTRL